jgi:hypothetical protein
VSALASPGQEEGTVFDAEDGAYDSLLKAKLCK